MALTADRDTKERSGDRIVLPVAASVTCYAGGLAARDANGRATPGATATTLRGVGRFAERVTNGVTAGAVSITIEKGIFRWANSADTDAIAAADIGADCYIVDDQTVAKTSGTSTRSVAGKIFDVDAQGVWVDMR
ncbi:hypothetical protein [Desulfobulbus elongatus]|uniref:hypothetical protein n=1 Tax=Desulfobulbus elongatus TaxID=53332 RepID=UPI0004827676|nr:hypothetical protein [Desulfobulbus elongatus]